MIGVRVMHMVSGEEGVVDAEATWPDGAVLVRLNDHWFFADDTWPVSR